MTPDRHADGIAIVGAGCRFPGGGAGPDGLWRLLRDGVDAIGEVPPERWPADRLYDPDPAEPGKLYARHGAFLDDVDEFDAAFFGITPQDAAQMDPQQRLLLEVAWEALEDAGIAASALAGTRTGVYTGSIGMDYMLLHGREAGLAGIDAWYASGKEFSFGPGRLSHVLGVHGPSMSLNTACSSSLVAVHLASQSLRTGESDLALVGGSSLMLSPELSMFMCRVGAMSPDGRCKVFDARADGTVRGEGAAVVVLKRLADAQADGDDVLAVIRGSAVNHDGPSAGLTVPNGGAQQELLRAALANAGVAPDGVGYVEAHGTGTPLGDPIEMESIAEVLGTGRTAENPIHVGSIKTNLGHTDAAAGLAGLLKTALALRHREIPPHLHFAEPHPGIRWDVVPIRVPTGPTPWPDTDGRPRLAGVSAFGLSGTNAHVVLEESTPLPSDGDERSGPVVLPVAARSRGALTDLAAAHRDRLADLDEAAVHDYTHTAGARRTHHADHRLAVVGESAAELRDGLAAFVDGVPASGVSAGGAAGGAEPVTFVFSGQGGQWAGMGRSLLREPVFRETLDACDALIREQAGWSVLAAIDAGDRLADTEVAQPVIFAVQVALAALWRSWGIEPDAVVGHSMGEVAAAHVAGVLDLRDAVRVIVPRGRLLQETTGQGRMAVVELPLGEAAEAVRPYGDRLGVAAVNAPRSTVLSGEPEALGEVLAELSGRGVECREMPGEYAFHSPAMAPYADRLAAELAGLTPRQPSLPIVPTTRGGDPEEAFTVAYWGRNVAEPVRFAPALDELIEAGHRTFVELGPHPVLAKPVAATLAAREADGLVVASLRRDEDDAATMLRALGELYTAGHDVCWTAVLPGRPAKLPTYPWQRRSHWFARTDAADGRLSSLGTSAEPEDQADVPDVGDLEEVVVRGVGAVLGLEPGQIDRDRGFAELGMDSITAVELRKSLQQVIGRRLSGTIAFDHPTVARLAAHLRTVVEGERAARPASAPETQTPRRPAADGQDRAIAVVGVGCRFPGGGDGPDGFWRLLRDGTDAITPAPQGRFPEPGPWYGAFLDDVAGFDARFFRVPPREARTMDPQQRLFLEVAWEALESAGQPADRLAGGRVGVFTGLNSTDYAQLLTANPDNIDGSYGTGNSFCATPGRLSFFLGVHGPSLAVDTACSSSLVAVHLALQSLRSGESDLAIAGGANLILTPTIHTSSAAFGALAADGRCKTFDASADGYSRGEGGGAVVLKRLPDALADGDEVLAVILGSAVNQDGPSSGLTVPNGPAQESLIQSALADAGTSGDEVGYVEAHGTGTPLGDPIELQALGDALGRRDKRCLVGSVKTNIGHLEAASGVAGLIKTVLALRHGEIPPHLHFGEPSPEIAWDELPFDVPTEPAPWPDTDRRVAGVSAFGFSGTNAHVVVAAPPDRPELPRHPDDTGERTVPYVLPISAATTHALPAQAAAYRELLAARPGLPAHDVCYTAAVRRTHHGHRLVVTGRDRAELIDRLTAAEHGETGPGVAAGEAGAARRPVFVFSGHGSQSPGMAAGLLRAEPVFRDMVRRCDEAMRPHLGWSVLDCLEGGGQTESEEEQQALLFAIQVGLAEVWRSYGVTPAAVVGHSVGEVAAAYVAGGLDLAAAARLSCLRSELIGRLVGHGAMGVVGLPADRAGKELAGYEDRLWVAVVNSSQSTVLSGDAEALQEVMDRLRDRNVFCRKVQAGGAGHSPFAEPLRTELIDRLGDLTPADPAVPFYSAVTGEPATRLDAGYWGRNIREPVRFADAVRRLAADGYDAFVEMSPHPLLLTPIEQELRLLGTTAPTVPSLVRDADDQLTMLTSFGALHAHGHPIDWSRLYPTGGRVVEAPTYAWEHKPYWLEHTEPRASGSAEQAAHPLLARQLRLAGDGPLVAEGDLDDAALDRLGARRYGAARLAPAATWLELAGAAHGADAAVECTDLRLPAPFAATDDPAVAQVALRPDGEFTAHTVPHHGAARLRAAGRFRAARGPLDAEPDAGQGDELPAEAVRSWLDRLGVPGLRSAHATGGPGSVVVELVHEGADPRWRLHPGLLEACLHTLELAVPPDGPLTVEHIDGARVAGPLGPKVRVRASVTETAAGTVTGDISVFDADGVPVVAAHGVRLGPVRLRPISPETRQELEDLLYDLVWRERPREATPHEDEATPHEGTAADGTWLVAADRGGVGTALAELLRARGDDVRVLDPTADLDRLTQEVRELVTGPGCRGAVHLWGLDVPGDPGPDDLDDASAVYASVGRLAAALDATAKASAPHVWYVTRGARQAGPEGASPVVGQAPIWTLGTVAGLEHPGAWGGLVDLDPATADPERAAEAILAELTGPDGEDRLALRQGHRYAGRLARRPVPERVAEPPELSPDGTYLVAAGASETHGVARAMADWLTSRGAAHVLVCGNAVEPADPDGRIRTERLDLADPATVRDLLSRLDAAGTPLRGVVWAAPEWSLAQDQQPPAPEAIAADLRNRALGARHLDAMAGDLDLFVVFAGAATSWGSMGAGRQAPADALLAALAERRTAAGRPALAVHWAPWDDEAALEQQTRVQMTRSGLSPLVPDSAVAALDYLAGTDAAEVCVARVDWSLMLPLYRQAIRWPLFDELAAQEAEAAKEAGPSAVAERLAGLPPEDRKDHLVDTVLGEVAVVLGMDAADDLEPTEGFFEIGMNSVTALELKVRLERLLRHELPATLAFECPTAADLAGFLLTELDGAADSSGEGPQPPQPAEPPETTTDEEPGDVMARFDAEMAAAEKATR